MVSRIYNNKRRLQVLLMTLCKEILRIFRGGFGWLHRLAKPFFPTFNGNLFYSLLRTRRSGTNASGKGSLFRVALKPTNAGIERNKQKIILYIPQFCVHSSNYHHNRWCLKFLARHFQGFFNENQVFSIGTVFLFWILPSFRFD